MGILPNPKPNQTVSPRGIRTTIPSKVPDDYRQGTDYLSSTPNLALSSPRRCSQTNVTTTTTLRTSAASSPSSGKQNPPTTTTPRVSTKERSIDQSARSFAHAAAAIGQVAFPAPPRTELGLPAPPQRVAQQSSCVQALTPRRWTSPPLDAFRPELTASVSGVSPRHTAQLQPNQFSASLSLSQRTPRVLESMVLLTAAGTAGQSPEFARKEAACLSQYYDQHPSRSPRRVLSGGRRSDADGLSDDNNNSSNQQQQQLSTPRSEKSLSLSATPRRGGGNGGVSTKLSSSSSSMSKGTTARVQRVAEGDEEEADRRRQQQEWDAVWFNPYAVMRDIGNFERKKLEREQGGPLLPPVASM